MFKDELVFVKNLKRNNIKPRLSPQKAYIYQNKSSLFGFAEISKLLNYLQNIKSRHKLFLFPIIIDLGNIIFADKLSYVLMECILYNLIVKENCRVTIYYQSEKRINTQGIDVSCMQYANSAKDEFLKKFSFDVYKKHFRRIIKIEELTPESISHITQDIESFLKANDIDDKCSDDISVVIGELVDNAIEHSKTDCLIDIDVTDLPWVAPDGTEVFGVNIVVLNFSDVLIYENLMKKINLLTKCEEDLPERYKSVVEAKKFHSQKWNTNYEEKDFFAITAFQFKISGREDDGCTGGRGLTELIKVLEMRADNSHCYVLSGNKVVRFIKEYLVEDSERWVGFNESCDYLTEIPDSMCIAKSNFYMPGTAYNLNFVLKKEVECNEQA